MTPSRLLLEKKEEQQEFIANAVKSAIERNAHAQRVGYWQGVPIFFKASSYTLAFHDPYMGVDVSCPAGWTEEDNQWRIAGKIKQFFQKLEAEIEERTETIADLRKKAEEFEQSAKAVFPHHEAWQKALSRRQALDAYIDLAAEAKSDQEHKKLAKMREHLLNTAPKEMTERPKPKHTATCVLPPRRPKLRL